MKDADTYEHAVRQSKRTARERCWATTELRRPHASATTQDANQRASVPGKRGSEQSAQHAPVQRRIAIACAQTLNQLDFKRQQG